MKKRPIRALAVVAGIALLSMALVNVIPSAVAAPANIAATYLTDLQTDGKIDSLGSDAANPILSWKWKSYQGGFIQESYRVTVTSEGGALVWDTGVVTSSINSVMYAGSALAAGTRYTWEVTATDIWDNSYTKAAWFETGLMLTNATTLGSNSAGAEAQWIGTATRTLDAVTAGTYDLSATIEFLSGSTKAAVIVSADDFEMLNANFNHRGSEAKAGSSYVKYEVDLNGTCGTNVGVPVLNVYLVGMQRDSANSPDAVDACGRITNVTSAATSVTLRLNATSTASRPVPSVNGTNVTGANPQLSYGPGGMNQEYPHLSQIGFATNAGQSARFTNITLTDTGTNYKDVLFSDTVGATYSIWAGKPNVTVTSSSVTVGSPTSAVMAYADPSFGSETMLRKEFTAAASPIVSARVYASAKGAYDLYVNGKLYTADEFYNPGNTDFLTTFGYETWDVTDSMKAGANVVGVQLSNGFWSGRVSYFEPYNYYAATEAFQALIVVTHADGSTEKIVTDNTWQLYLDGPLVYGSQMNGERYDATKEVPGWSEPNFSGSWPNAELHNPGRATWNAVFSTRIDKPVRVVSVDTAKSVAESANNNIATNNNQKSFIYDMGRDTAGAPRVTIPAGVLSEGTVVTMRYGQVMYPNYPQFRPGGAVDQNGVVGTLYADNYTVHMNNDFYIAKAADAAGVVIEVTSSTHCFQFFEITIEGYNRALPLANVQKREVSSSATEATFTSSNPLVNQLWQNITNTMRTNEVSYPTDNYTRERVGWMADGNVVAETAFGLQEDAILLYYQWLRAIRTCIGTDGGPQEYCPTFPTYNATTGVITKSAS
ncbi:MAG: family 78 glycoside hydrolase catalytic domain, partial [Propionibacteriaceae bacterium]|nr:family 78 glycoside hydrolase catalytic domain [Propionibacteriaceae bacterium]